MSPLIGIVLLVGGTVVLMAVVGPFVLSATGDVGADQPDADLRFAYTEDVDPAKTDSYGVSGDASGADGPDDHA